MAKTILITGSTDGIGKLAAIKMAKEGHHVYLHGRDPDKLDKVITEVQAACGHDHVSGFVADFSDLKQVRRMSQEVAEQVPHLDVLINNAGVFKSAHPFNEDGYDLRIVVNYLAPYVLTHGIWDTLGAAAAPRVINLSSAAQSSVSMSLLDASLKVSEQEAYAQSKLAILMWSFHLAKESPNVAVVALNPGSLLNTNMVREAYGKFWSSAEKGADIIYDLSLVQDDAALDGKYFDNDRGSFGVAHPDAYDVELIKALITKTEAIIK